MPTDPLDLVYTVTKPLDRAIRALDHVLREQSALSEKDALDIVLQAAKAALGTMQNVTEALLPYLNPDTRVEATQKTVDGMMLPPAPAGDIGDLRPFRGGW